MGVSEADTKIRTHRFAGFGRRFEAGIVIQHYRQIISKIHSLVVKRRSDANTDPHRESYTDRRVFMLNEIKPREVIDIILRYYKGGFEIGDPAK